MSSAAAAAASAAVSSPKQIDMSMLPSVKDGMSEKEEALKRRKTCRFIEEVGRVLKLPRVAIATAMVMFHRFYAKHSFQEHDRFEVAVAAILLAAKTEESPKKLQIVIEEAHKVKQRGMQAGRISQPPGSVPGGSSSSVAPLDPKGEEFLKFKERILLLERVILHTIGFELSIDHPYKFLVDIIKKLIHKRQIAFVDPKDAEAGSPSLVYNQMLNKMVQYSMSFANDSMQTSLCLQFEPQKVAIACVYLAGQFAKVKPVGGQGWLDLLGQPDVESLACISLQIVELVADRKGTDQQLFAQIRRDIDALKEEKAAPSEPEAKKQRVI